VETNDKYSADKQTSLIASNADGPEDVSGNLNCNESTKKEGW
jgi:hypothetical protein